MEVTYTLPYTYMSGRDHSASLSVGHRCLGTQVPDRGLAEVLTSPNKPNKLSPSMWTLMPWALYAGTVAGMPPDMRLQLSTIERVSNELHSKVFLLPGSPFMTFLSMMLCPWL